MTDSQVRPHLRPCPTCSRHVRVSECACPFCGASLDRSFRGSPAPLPPAARLSRAALFALGAGTVSLAAACGGATVGEGPGADEAGSAASDGSTSFVDVGTGVPLYGLPPPPPFDAGSDRGSMVAAYGLPGFPDAGADGPSDGEAGSARSDGGNNLDGSIGPLYGHAPIDAGSDGASFDAAYGSPAFPDAATDGPVILPPYGQPPPPPP